MVCPGLGLLEELLLEMDPPALHEGLRPLSVPLVSCAALESGTWDCISKAEKSNVLVGCRHFFKPLSGGGYSSTGSLSL